MREVHVLRGIHVQRQANLYSKSRTDSFGRVNEKNTPDTWPTTICISLLDRGMLKKKEWVGGTTGALYGGVLISKLISGLIEWNKSQSECYNDRRVVQAEGKAHDRHQRPERSTPSIPKQRRLYVIRKLPGGVRWGWRRVGQVQCPREPGRRNSTKTRPDIGARWRKFFSGCCKMV